MNYGIALLRSYENILNAASQERMRLVKERSQLNMDGPQEHQFEIESLTFAIEQIKILEMEIQQKIEDSSRNTTIYFKQVK